MFFANFVGNGLRTAYGCPGNCVSIPPLRPSFII